LAMAIPAPRADDSLAGRSSVALASSDDVRVTVSQVRYGSPFLATLIEYGLSATSVGLVVRDVLKGENSRLFNLLSRISRRTERQATITKRDLRDRVEIMRDRVELAQLESELSEIEEPIAAPAPSRIVETRWTIDPSTVDDLRERIAADDTMDPVARVEVTNALEQLAPLVRNGLSVAAMERVSEPDARS